MNTIRLAWFWLVRKWHGLTGTHKFNDKFRRVTTDRNGKMKSVIRMQLCDGCNSVRKLVNSESVWK